MGVCTSLVRMYAAGFSTAPAVCVRLSTGRVRGIVSSTIISEVGLTVRRACTPVCPSVRPSVRSIYRLSGWTS